MTTHVRWRLSAMTGLQFMALGAWYPVLPTQLQRLGYTGTQVGVIYSLLPLACIFVPPIAGQIADRYWSTDRLLASCHLIAGIALCALAKVTGYRQMMVLMLIWATAFAPTFALGNSITFEHLPEAQTRFGIVRVFGTLGWIAAGLVLSLVRGLRPETYGFPGIGGSDCLWMGGFISIALGLFCLSLPKTPPARRARSPWAFLSAAHLLARPNVLFFMVIVFVVSTEQMFHYVLTAPYLQALGVNPNAIPAVMTLAQITEIGAMLGLPWMLTKWGAEGTLAIGILAWPLRYAIFSIGHPRYLVISALALHGICYVCFSVVSFIHMNSLAEPDIRASAQALIILVSLGLGMYLGSLFAGFIRDYYVAKSGLVDYRRVFLVPTLLTGLCSLVFLGMRRRTWRISETQTPTPSNL